MYQRRRSQMRTPTRRFVDRTAAGRLLAGAVRKLELPPPLIVLGLPRGGVPVAFEVARELHAPLDVLVVRKIGMPGQPELAIGAIATGDIVVREPTVPLQMQTLSAEFERIAQRERAELLRRESAYRGHAPPLDLAGKTAILVDDGLATGATMIAAVRAARKAGAARVVVAAPVASDEAFALVGGEADQVAILMVPPFLMSVGGWYEDFGQTDDEEVRVLLERARASEPKSGAGHAPGAERARR